MGFLVYHLETDGKLILQGANPAAERITGMNANLLIGKTIEEAFPPLAHTEIPEKYRLTALQGIPWYKEHVDYKDENIAGAYEINTFRIAPNTMTVSFNDVTRYVQSESSLRQERDLKAKILETVDALVAVFDIDGKIMEFNRACVNCTGYTFEETQGRPFWDFLLLPEEQDCVKETFKRLKAGESANRFINYWLRKDGKKRLIAWSNVVLYDSKNIPAFIMSTGLDITDQRLAETELRRYQAGLEELVDERTHELKNAQEELIRNEKLAVLGHLTATVSHEIRNPLGTINSSLFSIEDALQSEDSERIARALKLAKRNVDRCNDIINELLDHTQKRELNLTLTDIDLWIATLVTEIDIPDEVRLKITLGLKKTLPIDTDKMRRAIVNIVENALSAMEGKNSGSKVLTIETADLEESVEIRIKDTGTGIPEAIRKKIFEPLFSTRRYGFGLGMSVIKDVIEDHGGGIEIDSIIGEGTQVTLWLPKAKVGIKNED